VLFVCNFLCTLLNFSPGEMADCFASDDDDDEKMNQLHVLSLYGFIMLYLLEMQSQR